MNKYLEETISEIGADAFLITDLEGNVVSFSNINYPENIALMTEAAFSMNKDLSNDLNNGELEQLITKTSKGIMITSKIENNIISIISNDFSKLGILLKKVSSISY